MDENVKRYFTNFGKKTNASKLLKKLTTKGDMTYKEKSQILEIALLFVKLYKTDKRKKSYLEFSYHIVLRYSLLFKDYKPLYDFSISLGLYPIARAIYELDLIDNLGINNFLLDTQIDNFKHGNIVETYEQQNMRHYLVANSRLNEYMSIVAPTSYGKSELIIEHIRARASQANLAKIAIIVPTKSLLLQTYKRVKQADLSKKLILHDEMYSNEDTFIAILTQERALRLMEKQQVYFDFLYVDEAHKLFEFGFKNHRGVLLSRVIRLNSQNNQKSQVLYFSPLINDSENLGLANSNIPIIYKQIQHNMKEADYYLFEEGKQYAYNRFVKELYATREFENSLRYMRENQGDKNFFFIATPSNIMKFATDFSNHLPPIELKKEIQDIIKELKDHVHEDFSVINMLEKGLVYIHGKLPEQIKEYLEYKFREISEIKYLVGNSVILEGVNLPIDTLFILSLWHQNNNDIINLIGRVNRLNEIFGASKKLDKLLMPIHFVQSDYYTSSMRNKLKGIRANIFPDKVDNPMLKNYDIEQLAIEKKVKVEKIQQEEELYFQNIQDDRTQLRKNLIAYGLNLIYNIDDSLVEDLLLRINNCKNQKDRGKFHIIDKLAKIFIDDLDIKQYEFKRLAMEEARDYYKLFLDSYRTLSFKEQINRHFHYIKEHRDVMYVGRSFGKVSKDSRYYNNGQNVYVSTKDISDRDLVNLIIIKLKIEEDFVSYTLNKFFSLMYDYDCITEDEYNSVIYGTSELSEINLIRTGLPINIIGMLKRDNQLSNIYLDSNKNLTSNDQFSVYKQSIGDFHRFQLEKYIITK